MLTVTFRIIESPKSCKMKFIIYIKKETEIRFEYMYQ